MATVDMHTIKSKIENHFAYDPTIVSYDEELKRGDDTLYYRVYWQLPRGDRGIDYDEFVQKLNSILHETFKTGMARTHHLHSMAIHPRARELYGRGEITDIYVEFSFMPNKSML